MADVEFHDFSMKVKASMDDAVEQFLIEAAGEVTSAAQRNSRHDSGELKGSWGYRIDNSAQTATIGSPLENAIWEEFGTGEFAAKKNGRKGYWVFVNGSGGGRKGKGKSYTKEQAKWIVARMREKGLDAYYTNGKKPNRALQRAIDSNKGKIASRAAQIIKGKMS